MTEKPLLVSERLMKRLRELNLPIPLGAQCVRNPLLQANTEETPWSWYVKCLNGRPLAIGSWDTMTDLMRTNRWEIWKEDDGRICVGPMLATTNVEDVSVVSGTLPRYYTFKD
jgi:hypothetical protein